MEVSSRSQEAAAHRIQAGMERPAQARPGRLYRPCRLCGLFCLGGPAKPENNRKTKLNQSSSNQLIGVSFGARNAARRHATMEHARMT